MKAYAIKELEYAIIRERGKLNTLQEIGVVMIKKLSIHQIEENNSNICNSIDRIKDFEQAIKHLHNLSQS